MGDCWAAGLGGRTASTHHSPAGQRSHVPCCCVARRLIVAANVGVERGAGHGRHVGSDVRGSGQGGGGLSVRDSEK